MKCSTLLKEMFPKSLGFIKWQPRCLNLNEAKASQSQRTCQAVSDACLHLAHLRTAYQPQHRLVSF
jgi:hypothetical protein